MRNERCKTNQSCKNNCPILEFLYHLRKESDSGKPISTIEAGIARARRDSGKRRCPPGEVNGEIQIILGR